MATEIRVNRAGTFENINYSDFEIELGTSTAQIAPTASVTSQARESIQAGQELRIIIDGTTRFEGVTQSAGAKSRNGQRRVEVEHAGVKLMEQPVSLSLSSPTVSSVLNEAVSAAAGGGGYTVNTAIPQITLGNDYNVESRKVKRIFRDMMDRAEAVWWFEPTGETINVEPPGGRGLWQSLGTRADRIRVDEFDEGDVKTVLNDVEVIGTGDVAVSATETDANSIDAYGRRTGESPYKVNYITTQTEADALAQALLQPDPLASGTVTAAQNVGAVEAPQINKTVDLTDLPKDIDESDLTINKQVIRQSRAELSVGQGANDAIARLNRNTKSQGDVTEPGSVYDSDRLADFAVLEDKIADLSITETKIQDDSISTPKLQAEAVVAAKIEAGTITALQIDTLDLTTNELSIGADATEQIVFGTDTVSSTDVTAMLPSSDGFAFIGRDDERFSEIFAEGINYERGTFEPPSASTTVGWGTDDADEPSFIPNADNSGRLGGELAGTNIGFNAMYAHNFVTLTPEPLSGVDLSKLPGYSWDQPPAYAAQMKASESDGRSYKRANPNRGIDLSHMTNYLLEATKALAQEKEQLEERVGDLEERLSKIEGQVS